jgi:hypothetical protein
VGADGREICNAIVEHKPEIIEILKEDATFRATGIVQSGRQVFDIAREVLGGEHGK